MYIGQTTDAVAASAGVGSYSQLGPRDGEHHGNKQDLS